MQLFCVFVIPKKLKFKLCSAISVENSSKWKGSEEMFKWKNDRCLFELFRRGIRIRNTFLQIILDSGSSTALFSLSIKPSLRDNTFFVKALNFHLFTTFVSSRFLFEVVKNEIISSKHFIQYQANELFCRNLYVCKLILLHLICTHKWQLSHWTKW